MKQIKTNIDNFLSQTSEHQHLFRFDSRRQDYLILKGNLTGKWINDLCKDYLDETLEMLDNIYTDENSNSHTRMVIDEIINNINS